MSQSNLYAPKRPRRRPAHPVFDNATWQGSSWFQMWWRHKQDTDPNLSISCRYILKDLRRLSRTETPHKRARHTDRYGTNQQCRSWAKAVTGDGACSTMLAPPFPVFKQDGWQVRLSCEVHSAV